MADFKKEVLKNGLRLILIPQPESLATTVAVLVEAGSKYETKEINGISHFLEHMCFKGTKKRPKAIDIASELDGLGAEYNAFTSQEYTSYYAKVKSESVLKALEIVADMYLNPIFNPEEIEKEKGVIIGEINMYEDMPQRKVQELFMELVYGDQPAGWSVAGRKEVIKKITQADFLSYRKAHYLPQSTIVVVAGKFDEKEIVKKIDSYFSGLSAGLKNKKLKVLEKQEKPEELVKFKESDQTHLILGFRAFSIFDPRRFTLRVLADVLGGGMSSRLFQRIRGELGAAYYVHAEADLLSDHGIIGMSAGVHHEKLETVIKVSLEEFGKFKNKLVGKEELQKSKDHIIGQLFLSVETSDEIGYFYGGEEVMGLSLKTPQEIAASIQAVTPEQIKSVANDLFKKDRLNLALIGPFRDKSFSDILNI